LVGAGVEAVMGAYNRTLGEPCCGSRFLLTEMLRERWNFKGHVVSDCAAIDDFHTHHKVTRNAAESAALAVKNGCDLNCGCTYNDLIVAVKEGLITEAEIEVSLRRLLSTKFKLGLFDPQELVPWSRNSTDIIDSPVHRTLARKAALESVVLLKNNGILPLRPDHESILVTGPTAASVTALLGNYYGLSPRMVTILEGITGRVSEGCRVVYRIGCPLSGPMAPGTNYTWPTATENELTIAVIGLDGELEGEEGDTVSSATGGDRGVIELPRTQKEFLLELRKHARKLVVVLTGGSAIAIPEVHEFADAVLQVWYPGCEGGNAVAEILFGDASPSGRMPVTVPYRTEDLPPFEEYAMAGRTYRFATKEPLYPFGYGLGYGRTSYSDAVLSSPILPADGNISIQATVTNHGKLGASEVVQCYVQPPRDWPNAPLASLVGFQKVQLLPGESRKVSFTLPASAFAQFNSKGEQVHAPGRYGLVVGTCSPGARGQVLGAPVPVSVELNLV